MWSNNHRCAILLTFDFDAETIWEEFGLDTPSNMSRGYYGARVGVPRILALLARHEIPATFFVPGINAERYPNLLRAMHDAGHEIGHHGYRHRNPTAMSLDEERAGLEQGIEALTNVGGVRPVGYRSPSWDLSPNSIPLLREYGFLYDSSMMADDFHPYAVEWEGQPTELVELPVAWELDDAPHFFFSFNPYRVGSSAPSKVYEIWASEFEGAYLEEGVYLLTMHPQMTGRYHRLKMLEQLIEHIKGHDGVWFTTCAELAQTWRSRQNGSV
jgi:peptidoglycan/xylan/chitin deacetylase (PgdA/CDA1 family)